MSICAYLLTWETIFSKPELAKDTIDFINLPLTENTHQGYEIKDKFLLTNSFELERMNIVKMSYTFSQLNAVNYSSNLFKVPLQQTLNYAKKNQQQQTKSDGAYKPRPSRAGSAPHLNAQLTNSLKLSPEENPLIIPTKPQEVEIDQLAPLTLEKAIEIAETNNRQLKIAKLELERAKSALNAEKAAWFPSVGLQSGLTRSQNPSNEVQANITRDRLRQQIATIPTLEAQLAQTTNPIEQVFLEQELQQARNARTQLNDLDNFATTTIDGSVAVDFSLLSPQRQALIKIAREEVRFNELEIQNIQQILRLQVAEVYYNLQQSDREVAIAEKDVTTRQQGVEIVSKLLNAALATRLDLLNAEVELDNAIQILRNAKAQQLIARRDVAQILSLPADVTPTAADQVAIKDRWDLSLEETIILAFQNRVELEQRLAERRLGEGQRKLAWAAIKPRVGLFASYDFAQFYSDEPGDNGFRGFGDGYSLGVNFNWTFWDGGVASARAKEAKAIIAIAEQQYANSANQIRFEVEQAYLQLPANLENVETATEAVARAEAAVEAAEIRFRANLNTQTEVLDARTRLVQAENNLVRAIIGYNRALAALQRAVGATKIDKNLTIQE